MSTVRSTVTRLADFKSNSGMYSSGARRRDELATRRLLRRAAKALPNVYGRPKGSDSLQAAVRLAKRLLRDGAWAISALEQAASEHLIELDDLARAVLEMSGAKEEV